MSRAVALTTTDNPYDPFTQYDEWYRYDNIEHDYGTQEYLDRICHTTSELGDEMYMNDIEDAIDEIVKYNLISWWYQDVSYKKVVLESKAETK